MNEDLNKPASSGKTVLGILIGVLIGVIVTGIICVPTIITLKKVATAAASGTQTSSYASDSGGEAHVLDEEALAKLSKLFSYVDQLFLYDYDAEAVNEALYKAAIAALDDPYTAYYTAKEYAALMESATGQYSGLGAIVSQYADTGEVVILRCYSDSPAEKAGLEPGDIILEADGVEITGTDLDETVATLFRGEAGTTVNLKIYRESTDETFEVTVTRAVVDVDTVWYTLLDNNIGYIEVVSFDSVTTDQFSEAYDDLVSQGMKGLIIDLRNNGGGLVNVTTDMLDELLPEGVLVYTMDAKGNRMDYNSDEAAKLDIPCAVLVNENTASASEIFAGAMQDYDAAEIIGAQTFGKGVVQVTIPLADGSGLKLTIQNYYTPNGNNIHGIGITPDQVVEFDEEAYTTDGTDTQLDAAIEYLTKVMQ